MGFIHDTGDRNIELEERSESIVLAAIDDHVFIPWTRPNEVLLQVTQKLRRLGGESHAAQNDQEAKFFRRAADEIEKFDDLHPTCQPDSLEVTKAWLRDVVNFVNENPDVLEEDE